MTVVECEPCLTALGTSYHMAMALANLSHEGNKVGKHLRGQVITGLLQYVGYCLHLNSFPLESTMQTNETDVTMDISECFSFRKDWAKCESMRQHKVTSP